MAVTDVEQDALPTEPDEDMGIPGLGPLPPQDLPENAAACPPLPVQGAPFPQPPVSSLEAFASKVLDWCPWLRIQLPARVLAAAEQPLFEAAAPELRCSVLGCKRPKHGGFETCCGSCVASASQKHGPRCNDIHCGQMRHNFKERKQLVERTSTRDLFSWSLLMMGFRLFIPMYVLSIAVEPMYILDFAIWRSRYSIVYALVFLFHRISWCWFAPTFRSVNLGWFVALLISMVAGHWCAVHFHMIWVVLIFTLIVLAEIQQSWGLLPGKRLAEDRFVKIDAEYTKLSEHLDSSAIVFLKMTWLASQVKTEVCGVCRRIAGVQPIKKRQDLATAGLNAFASIQQSKTSIDQLGALLVLSYGWLSKDHPDPRGEHVKCLFEPESISFGRPEPRFAVQLRQCKCMFWDWTSLFQMPRSPMECRLFKAALASLHLVYSHPYAVVLRITSISSLAENRVPYLQRGWPTFETGVAAGCAFLVLSTTNDAHRKHSVQDKWNTRLGDAATFQSTLARPAPQIPQDFDDELDMKEFTSRNADLSIVKALYLKVYPLVTSSPCLQVGDWDSVQAIQFMKALSIWKSPKLVRVECNYVPASLQPYVSEAIAMAGACELWWDHEFSLTLLIAFPSTFRGLWWPAWGEPATFEDVTYFSYLFFLCGSIGFILDRQNVKRRHRMGVAPFLHGPITEFLNRQNVDWRHRLGANFVSAFDIVETPHSLVHVWVIVGWGIITWSWYSSFHWSGGRPHPEI